MNSAVKLVIALFIAGTAAACGPAIVADPGGRLIPTGLGRDGDCVSRRVLVYDREVGYEVPATERFCGESARLAP